MKGKILLVEDESNFGMVLRDYLTMNDYEVTLCDNGEKGLTAFSETNFDLCVVDVMMPKKDGFTLASEIRQINKQIPFVFLTARSMREDIIKGYKLGAADYITKPFDSEVLLYKLNAILNINHPISESIILYNIGSFVFNSKLRTLKNKDSAECKLSPKESALLSLLCQYKNDVLPREKALKQIWGNDSYFTARSMDVYIVKLRKYLSDDKSVEINNVHGNGYSLSVK